MPLLKENYLVIGTLGSTYGIQGWIKVFSYSDDIMQYENWYLEETDQQWKPVIIQDSREHGKGMIVKFAGINNPEQARLLTGKKIAILRSALPALKKDDYYWADLEGLTVIDQHGKTLGTVINMLETGANDVMIIKTQDGKHHAIPFLLKQVVTSIDLTKQEMRVEWELI